MIPFPLYLIVVTLLLIGSISSTYRYIKSRRAGMAEAVALASVVIYTVLYGAAFVGIAK